MQTIPKLILHIFPKARSHNSTAMGGTALYALALLVLLSGCLGDRGTTSHTKSFVSSDPNTANQQITYSTGPQDVLIRTFYGGGLYGSLSLAPQVSIYGDGTYILNTTRQGELSSDALQALLHTLVDKDGLLNLPQQQFADIPDQNATFLLLNLNGEHLQLMYGSFGNQQESKAAMDAYHRLGQALTSINNALTGATQPYHGHQVALLVRQDFSPNLAQPPTTWPLTDFTLAQAAVFECGLIPLDQVDQNQETGCLKYTIPQHAILLTAAQLSAIQQQLNTQQQGDFSQGNAYYTVTLRQLLPDELPAGQLAMFGSAQESYVGVPLLQGSVPPIPTPTPSR
jgi:hypothetical protein